MPVSHARAAAVTSTDEEVPGLLEALAQVPDPRKERGRRFTLVFVLAVAVVCVLAGANHPSGTAMCRATERSGTSCQPAGRDAACLIGRNRAE
jgi:DDE_Tnp_1-associated